MTHLLVYDTEAKDIEDIAERLDVTVAEVVEALVECFNDNDGESYIGGK